jgi:hypothetical protein
LNFNRTNENTLTSSIPSEAERWDLLSVFMLVPFVLSEFGYNLNTVVDLHPAADQFRIGNQVFETMKFHDRFNQQGRSVRQVEPVYNYMRLNYQKMFYMEMDKVHLFHQLGKYDFALMLLYNMELCGLDYNEQVHVNHWKYELENEVARINFGYEAETEDTNWVDTCDYIYQLISLSETLDQKSWT